MTCSRTLLLLLCCKMPGYHRCSYVIHPDGDSTETLSNRNSCLLSFFKKLTTWLKPRPFSGHSLYIDSTFHCQSMYQILLESCSTDPHLMFTSVFKILSFDDFEGQILTPMHPQKLNLARGRGLRVGLPLANVNFVGARVWDCSPRVMISCPQSDGSCR